MTQKRCYDCGLTKPVEDFNKNRRQPDGRHRQCRACGKITSARYRAEHREAERARHAKHERTPGRKAYNARKHRKRLYGLSEVEFNKCSDLQGYSCAICRDVEIDKKPAKYPGKAKSLHVDHSHTTGKVRGLLCSNCNHLLGHAADSVERLQAAAQYLLNAQG